jgi:hypothetical protein
MTEDELIRAATRLDAMRRRRTARVIAAAVAAPAAIPLLLVASWAGIGLLAGAGCVLLLALADTLRRRDLLATLAVDPRAYVVPDVRRYGARLVLAPRLRRAAASLERVLANAGSPGTYYLVERVDAHRSEIEAVARAFRTPGSRVEPTSVALCWRLLTRMVESPLYNWRLPAEDLARIVRRIQSGIHQLPALAPA